MKILLAEDEDHIADHICAELSRDGYLVERSTSGPQAWDLGETNDYSAIILDLGLPGIDGLSILKGWRKAGVETPVLILTARGTWMERVDGFEAGADDYLPKPFRTEELKARLKALLRRSGKVLAPVKATDRFLIDDRVRRVTFDGRELDLTPLEYRMVSIFLDSPGTVFSAADLASQVQGRDDDTAKNAVEAMIGRLRRKTDIDAIETRRGFGYVLPERQR